ncbi:MAG: DNA polymerase III subunit delta [Oscillospiraceae bacterium]|nr:DNA polymerase III subunit delta [Candidatus Equicaccousia limihippi]
MFNEIELKRDIASGCTKAVYFLFGDDSYLVKLYADKIATAVCKENSDVDKLSFERDTGIDNVINEADQFSFFGGRRCLLVPDFDFESCDKEEYGKFKKLLSEENDNVLVFYYEMLELDLKKSSKVKTVFKILKENDAFVCELNHRTESELAAAIIKAAQKRGTAISQKNAKYLIERVSKDLNTLINETDKLSLFSDGEITEKEIDELCNPALEASIYDITNNIVSGNSDKAFEIIDNLVIQKIPVTVILFEISSFFTDVYNYRCACIAKKYGDSAAEELNYAHNVLFRPRKNGTVCKDISDKSLNNIMQLILDADRDIKESGGDVIVLEKLIVKIISEIK